jgi:uncharacterized protein YndB with AHSA1/START domain
LVSSGWFITRHNKTDGITFEKIKIMTMKNNNDHAQKKNIVLTRVFDAPPERVWKAWTQSEYVKQWWGPKGFTCPIAEMDVREGGKTRVCMQAPEEYGGQKMYNTWTYSRVVPNERLEYILNFTDKEWTVLKPAELGLPAGIPGDVPHEITLKDPGTGKTAVTVKEFGYTTEKEAELSRQGMEECLDKMAAIFD